MEPSAQVCFAFSPPSKKMAPFVWRYWQMRSVGAQHSSSLEYRALPTAHNDVVFNLSAADFHNLKEAGATKNLAESFFVGMADQHETWAISGPIDLFGIHFRHEILRDLLRYDLYALTDKRIDLADLANGQLTGLVHRLRTETEMQRRVFLSETYLADVLSDLAMPRDYLSFAIQAMLKHPEESTIQGLAEKFDVSKRHLERHFRQYIGLTPKRFKNVGRFIKATHCLRAGMSFSETALDLGFADQAHFGRSFKYHSGLTPSAYLKTQNVAFLQDENHFPD